MQKNITDLLFKEFPKLKSDYKFKVTSPHDPRYNCIAWALIKNDVFVWPDPRARILDGLYWPENVDFDPLVENFIKLFQLSNYEICPNWEFEKGYQKIALYINPVDSLCTHAARQLSSGLWTSKMGQNVDIEHSNPFSLESATYGIPKIFMKRGNTAFGREQRKKLSRKHRSKKH